jgi:hypothetical protein
MVIMLVVVGLANTCLKAVLLAINMVLALGVTLALIAM